MRHSIRALLFGLVAATFTTAITAVAAHAQASQRGQPTTAFGVSDFAKLRWLEGWWEGTAPGETNIYQRARILNDSTIELTYYGDPDFTRETGTGRVYLSVGRVYHTFGSGRWGATHVDADGVYFVPQVNAHNTFAWSPQSPDAWTATLRTGLSGRERVTVYHMKRIKR